MEPDRPTVTDPDFVSPREPTHSASGSDLTLIRWMLSLTPLERLHVLQEHAAAVQRIRDANPRL